MEQNMIRTNKVLVNFLIEKPDKIRFDEICRLSGKTRTQVLVDLVRRYVIEASLELDKRLKEMGRIDDLLGTYHEHAKRQKRLADEIEFELPPSIFVWDGREPEPPLDF